MLVQLAIRNLGLIESAELELGPGLQVITGETGVGKTLLIRSMDLLRGIRGRTEWIRSRCDEAQVSGFFAVRDPAVSASIRNLTGIEVSDGEILIERRLRRSSRSPCRLNGREIPVSLLREVGSVLMEVNGQASQLSLLIPTRQLALLDRFAEVESRRDQFRQHYREAREIRREIVALRRQAKERHERRIFLEHVVAELSEARVDIVERPHIEREVELAAGRDGVLRNVGWCLERLYESEDSVLDQISRAERQIMELGELHPSLAEFVKGCAEARVSLEEGTRALQRVREEVESAPDRLFELERRLDGVVALEERYRRSPKDLLRYLEEARTELGVLDADQDRLPELEAKLLEARAGLQSEARSLSRRRRRGASRLAASMAREMVDLGMTDAVFEARLSALDPEDGWDGLQEHGADQLEFFFGGNPGEPSRPLRNVASGGELARLMLSLKKVLADEDQVPTVVFDEVDSGVGGRLGMILGRKLKEIGATHQVLCVTHLPQVASFANGHFRVTKEPRKKRTVTVIDTLVGEPRLREIATMIRGEQHSENSLEEAREMVQEAREPGPTLGRGADGCRGEERS